MTHSRWWDMDDGAPKCNIFNRESTYFHVQLTTVRHLLNVNGFTLREYKYMLPYCVPYGCSHYSRLNGNVATLSREGKRLRRLTGGGNVRGEKCPGGKCPKFKSSQVAFNKSR